MSVTNQARLGSGLRGEKIEWGRGNTGRSTVITIIVIRIKMKDDKNGKQRVALMMIEGATCVSPVDLAAQKHAQLRGQGGREGEKGLGRENHTGWAGGLVVRPVVSP